MVYWRSILFVFFGACSYGMLSTFVKLAYKAGFLPGEVSGSQMFLAMVCMWGVALLFSRQRIGGKQCIALMGVGVASGLTGILYYQSLQYVPASIAIVLLFQFTWIGVIIAAIMERKKPGIEKIVALILLMVGTLLSGDVFTGGFGQLNLIGIVFGLLSAVTYALFVIFSGRAASSGLSPYTRAAVTLTGAMLITFIIYPPSFLINGALTSGLLLYVLPLALFGGIIPVLFFTLGVSHIGGGLATILSAAELPTAVLLSRIVLHENVSMLQWIGVSIILGGIAFPELIRKRRTNHTQTDTVSM
ncbi:hypothetical protein AM501_21755 [Aneurinibacillus migulanus]|uniref:EamA family transporter n=1 Tax=Aneurinibacillus migulanus TaxID=47500 RepID=UPI0005B8F1F7|nr:DMT family transporter [Aneurinibacillus migulanus]KIV58018.1 hypothetical protein TS64_05565 [Aneurinibacillus migulanus]KPD06236.1 hypothetical protein AM501_21755 [Aneurinibacillus migulanus]MCP1355908.1 DMT family transporter [Aneurinibacillus migulanus]CEH28492.1 Putative membrane protein [Aneurinibacillus migulanus]